MAQAHITEVSSAKAASGQKQTFTSVVAMFALTQSGHCRASTDASCLPLLRSEDTMDVNIRPTPRLPPLPDDANLDLKEVFEAARV